MATPAVASFEVTGKDGPSLQRFYGERFDCQVQDAGGGSGYGLVQAAKKGIGGGIGQTAAYLQKAEQPGLTFACFADPEDHLVGLSEGAVR